MILSSIQLEAFAAASRTLNFSRAAQAVHITQSALSQRIQNLEQELGLTLLIRNPKGVQLTEAGARLLRYCQTKDAIESELLDELNAAPQDGFGGRLRLAGYSTVMRLVAIPALAPLLRKNPRINFELNIREMRDLPGMLLRGEADFIILDHVLKRSGIEAQVLGHESYVMVESSRFSDRSKTFLDHDPEDTTTEDFFRRQGTKPSLQRSYLDDIGGIISGVSLGLGRAVVPKHLITRKGLPIKIARGFKPYHIPVVLHYFTQPYYSKLHQAIAKLLIDECPAMLGKT